ncbi:TPA: type IV secretory system conjugative DNA transfer family protein [Streptococcus pyogenes]|uniref:VirD4-like conjugal transfer protein, CD1115 family n=1 Tax=Streptococcus dysgalactiae TaxID=1334 RepID=UPI002B1BE6D9|nr:type IV secretory system conjugative DNA transfer family protein [Streptococcus pyogenes]HEP4643535.1 type IV secretory system conjugative DNA transfer family protein [Streptococcus pyogenes]HEP4646816.1 type IV secretory system conjugative DNA transfer family protein [Streptococcus pyogenes]HEP4648616.1 type IV secretory system conjugative DNA transfer family protein [Streptococcus pyogenes]HEP4650363.1 type IV secretory system conjugative DNA transfer family protein [Streptococcus pyogenes
MISEQKKRRFLPYFLIGIVMFYFSHWLIKLYAVAPKSSEVTIFDTTAFNWMYDHWSSKPLLDFQFTMFSLYGGIVVFFIVMLFYFRVTDNGKYRHGEEYGSARYATIKELATFRDKEPDNDMIFSQNARMGLFNKRLPFNKQLNKNTLTVGLPGDGKTFTFVKPNLMQMNSSFVITDPKGLLVRETGKMLEDNGYKIKVFDLVNLTNSNQFNVFHYMHSELDIDRVSEAIIAGTKRSDNNGEDFWNQAEILLMRALIGYLYFDGKVLNKYEPNIAQVADLLRNIRRADEDIPSPVERMFEELEKELKGNYACRQWELFNSNFEGKTMTSVLSMISSRIAVFDHDAVRNLISRDSMEMEKWQTEKTAVFIAIPETDKSYNFIATTMFTMMFRQLPLTADEILQGKHKTCKRGDLLHIRLILDEFANFGRFPNFTETLSSVRSREISIDIIIQAVSQLKALYKAEWETIFNNCATLIYLGTNDKETMSYFSMRSGKQTLNVKNQSQTRGSQGSSSQSIQTIQRDLLTPDEIARIGVDEALIFISKQNVFKDKKTNVLQHPRASELSNSPDDGNWYNYIRSMNGIDDWDANVNHDRKIIASASEVEDTKLPFQEALAI